MPLHIITYDDILALKPCPKHHPSRYIPKTWRGTAVDVLEYPGVGSYEKLWVAFRVLDDRILKLFAIDCARRALAKVPKPDIRGLIAVNLAEAYVYGRCSKEELKAATAAAYDAANAAANAAAAYAAAYDAANAAAADAAAGAAYAAAYAARAAADAAAGAAYAADAVSSRVAFAATADYGDDSYKYDAAYTAERDGQVLRLLSIIKKGAA